MQRRFKKKHMVQIIIAAITALATIIAAVIAAKDFGVKQGEEQARKEFLAMNQTINLTINGQEMSLGAVEVNELVNELYAEYVDLRSKHIELESANTFLTQRVDALESQNDIPSFAASPESLETNEETMATVQSEIVEERAEIRAPNKT